MNADEVYTHLAG